MILKRKILAFAKLREEILNREKSVDVKSFIIDEESIRARVSALQNTRSSSRYERQKSSL